jgi:DNA-binding MarR family transcriptional regulator
MKSLNNISRAQQVYRKTQFGEELPVYMHPYILSICKNPGLTQDELGADLCVSKSMVSRRVEWLESNGYITRKIDPEDKRRQRLEPTEKALKALPELRRISREWMTLISEGIDADELMIFEKVLEKLEAKAREVAKI